MLMIPMSARSPDNDYPTTDRRIMPGTDWHRTLMTLLINMLWEHFLSQPRVYVSGDVLVFHEKGNKRKHVSPDVFFVRGVEKRMRRNYLVWEEKQAPQVVIELTSESTREVDTGRKMALYRDVLKVREYFLFDPEDGVLDPRLQGYRLWRGQYRPIQAVAGRLPSQLLGLHLEADGTMLRLWDPGTQAWLLTPDERAEQERDRAEQERAARQTLEERVAALEAQLARLTGQANGAR